MSSLTPDVRAAIERAAREEGINPSFALAVAERESNFNPLARSSKTIAGIFQMRGDLRHEYGAGDSTDPYTQAKGWARFIGDAKSQTAATLGRDPTDSELYLSHHFGSTRAAKMLQMDPATPVSHVFSDYERSINPHFDKAGTVGALNSSVMSDIGRRQARYGGASEQPDFASFGDPITRGRSGEADKPSSAAPDFSSFGELASYDGPKPPSATAATSAPDFSSFGTPA